MKEEEGSAIRGGFVSKLQETGPQVQKLWQLEWRGCFGLLGQLLLVGRRCLGKFSLGCGLASNKDRELLSREEERRLCPLMSITFLVLKNMIGKNRG